MVLIQAYLAAGPHGPGRACGARLTMFDALY